jgi:glycosyltransferase involved in cell wall biosynthesis
MMLEKITPLILTFNEEPNIQRVLERLTWAREVVVLDSGSTDRTKEIALSFPNVRWETRVFDSFAGQCNFALENLLSNVEWVLSLDSDYVLGTDCEKELNRLCPETWVEGYQFGFVYCVEGKPLRGTLYPPRVCLFRSKTKARYAQDGHAHRLILDGKVVQLSSKILHDDRKPLSRWLVSQSKYAEQEADLILSQPWGKLRLSNRIRKWIVLSPVLAPLVYLFLRGGIFDGRPGLVYAFQRLMAEAIISIKLLERQITQEGHSKLPAEKN